MSKSTKRTLIVVIIIAIAYTLVLWLICNKADVPVYGNDIKETTEAWQKINERIESKILDNYPILNNANGTGCTRIKTLEERVSELERKVEALSAFYEYFKE